MKSILYLVLGGILVLDIIYKLFNCPFCESTFLGYTLPGYVHLAVLAVLASLLIFRGLSLRNAK